MTRGLMPNKYSLRCLKAVEALHGGREALAQKMGISGQTIASWVHKQKIPRKAILSLVELSNEKFSTDEFIGRYDDGDFDANG